MIKFRKFRQTEFKGVLIELVKLFEPNVYCEIGVKKGYIFNEIAPLVDFAIGVDPAGAPVTFGNHVEFYEMTSDKFFETYDGPTIDFAFIDGDHRHFQVEKDIDNMVKIISNHTGLIFLHDTYPVVDHLEVDGYCSDAWKAAAYYHEYGAMMDIEIVTLPGPWAGLSIMRKRLGGHLHWK